MPVRLEKVIELIHDACRWSDGVRDYIPELGCSSCGRAVVPLSGLSVNRKVSPSEYKDVVLKSRKMILETGKYVNPMTVQVVSASVVSGMHLMNSSHSMPSMSVKCETWLNPSALRSCCTNEYVMSAGSGGHRHSRSIEIYRYI